MGPGPNERTSNTAYEHYIGLFIHETLVCGTLVCGTFVCRNRMTNRNRVISVDLE